MNIELGPRMSDSSYIYALKPVLASSMRAYVFGTSTIPVTARQPGMGPCTGTCTWRETRRNSFCSPTHEISFSRRSSGRSLLAFMAWLASSTYVCMYCPFRGITIVLGAFKSGSASHDRICFGFTCSIPLATVPSQAPFVYYLCFRVPALTNCLELNSCTRKAREVITQFFFNGNVRV